MSRTSGLALTNLLPYLFCYTDRDATEHLLRCCPARARGAPRGLGPACKFHCAVLASHCSASLTTQTAPASAHCYPEDLGGTGATPQDSACSQRVRS